MGVGSRHEGNTPWKQGTFGLKSYGAEERKNTREVVMERK